LSFQVYIFVRTQTETLNLVRKATVTENLPGRYIQFKAKRFEPMHGQHCKTT